MKLFRLMSAVALTGLLALTANSADPVKEPTKQDIEDAGKRADLVADIALANTLAAYGRGEACEATSPKDFKSPESLVLAGGILWRADKASGGKVAELDIKPTDEKGGPIESKAEKSKSLKDQAKELFDEARASVAESKDASRKAAIEAMIKREESSEASRGAVGGPQQTTRVLQPGETHSFKISYVGGVPAAVAMTSTGPAKIDFNLTHVGGNNLFNSKGQNAGYNWVPARDKNGIRLFNLTLTNMGKKPTMYVLAIN